jgi:GH35 family endo-1,4-beta-xylanase
MIPLIRSSLLAFFAVAGCLPAIEVPAGGTEVSAPSTLNAYVAEPFGRAEKFGSAGGADSGCWRITVSTADSARPYSAQCSVSCPKGALATGDRVLAIIKARVTGGEKGALEAKLQLNAAPYTAASRPASFDISPEWTEYPVLFVVESPLPEGKAGLTLFCAQAVQTIEIAGIRVFRYGPDADISKFPRIRRTYVGRAPDAPWRKAALERIEKIRKADCSLAVKGPDGQPLANQPVKLTLRRHEFGFGSATPAYYYAADTEDARRYRDIIDRLFSIVVFENDLKDFWWGESTPAHERKHRREEMDKAFAWLAERHIAVRGHYLMQVAVPGNVAKMDNEAIRRHFMDTTRQRIEFAGNRVCEWDAINHPVAWGGAELFSRRPGLERLDREILSLARGLTKLPLWVNEDQLFRPGPQSDGTWNYLRDLKESGIQIDGLGNQAHIHESYLPSPEHVLAVTDRFAEVVPRQAITEFDLQTIADEELAADYTRDLLIACFSHPAYTSFLLWGFWEGSHWEPSAASWKKDWTPLPRAEVLEEWLGKRWRTEVTLTTNAAGVVRWRGFPGWYEVKSQNGKRVVMCNLPMARPTTSVTLAATE